MHLKLRRSVLVAIAVLFSLAAAPLHAKEADAAAKPKTRTFEFTYGAVIEGLKPGVKAQVWLPVAQAGPHQDVEVLRIEVPGKHRIAVEKQYGNRILHFEAKASAKGEIPFSVVYRVTRRESLQGQGDKFAKRQAKKFLRPNRMVPVDGSLLNELFPTDAPKGEALQLARRLYEKVDERMRYGKPEGKPWGRGDARWACDAGFGNCTDFHSLFISASRDLGIPAKFEIGFPIPTKRSASEVGGYHCWAKFAADGRWSGVDISEADKDPLMKKYYFGNLTPDRVTFSTGRDLTLVPKQAAGPVNFLVYPYVEVDGKQHTKFRKAFKYRDLK